MEVPKRVFSLLFCFILLCTISLGHARSTDLTLEVLPLIPTTITNAQLAHYDISGTGSGPTLFKILLHNSGTKKEEQLAIVYTISVQSTIISNGNQVLYKGISSPFSLNAGESISLLSNSFLQEDGIGIHQDITLEEMENTVLENQVIDAGKIPTGELIMQFELVRRSGTGSHQYDIIQKVDPLEVEIHNVSQLDLVSPGTSTEENTVLEITTPLPRFIWNSDLLTNIYDDCALCLEKDLFEVLLYEKKAGQTIQEALSSPPLITGRTKEPFFYYPITGKQLEKGHTYLWQVRAFLKGVKNSYLLSDTFIFRYAEIGDPQVEEIRQLLLTILANSPSSDTFLELSHEYGHQIEVTIDGKIITIHELKALAKEFTQGDHAIISTEIE